MHAYKFRILSDEVEDFLRDIEILASQSFLDFHSYLVKLLEFSSKELASFSICNSRWHKLSEITLMDMGFEMEDTDTTDEEEGTPRAKTRTYLMADSKLRDFIEDPHQRIIYEYDYLNPKMFFIELNKILPSEAGLVYPRCVRSEGSLPQKVVVPAPGMEPEGDALLDLDEGDTAFEEELDDNFIKNLDDGFEVEEDQSAELNLDETYDSSFDDTVRI